MNDNFIIRQATIHDLHRLIPIFDDYRAYFKQERNPAKVESFLFERFEHRESVLFIAEDRDEIVGFAHLYPTFSSLSLQRVWILNDFFIMEHVRNRGIGKRLFREVEKFAAFTKAKGIELSVEHTNTKAREFWEKRGFQNNEEFRYYFYKLS